MGMLKIANKIKKRETASDVFITPVKLCIKHISLIDYKEGDRWLDPFKNTGNYYNNFPTQNKDWTEILDNRDFFEYKEPVDIICSNPPYSLIDEVLEHSVSLQPRVISYLIGMLNLTKKRIHYMNQYGYGLTKIHICRVYGWFAFSVLVVFEKDKDNIVTYDIENYK